MMIFVKFFRQQDWAFAIPCMMLFCLIHLIDHSLAISLVFATAFLICYGLKFARKYDNQLIDQLKIIFYFIYLTFYILYPRESDIRTPIEAALLVLLFVLYVISLLLFYKREHKQSNT